MSTCGNCGGAAWAADICDRCEMELRMAEETARHPHDEPVSGHTPPRSVEAEEFDDDYDNEADASRDWRDDEDDYIEKYEADDE